MPTNPRRGTVCDRVIDVHCHVLPGLDDGAPDLATSLEMLRRCEADGVTTVVATPHVNPRYGNRAATIHDAVDALRAAAAAEGIGVEVLPGAEVAFDVLGLIDEAELRALCLGGDGGTLLLEAPYTGMPLGLAQTVTELAGAGVRVLLAHPERNPDVRESPEVLRPLVEMGVCMQLTAAALTRRGRDPVAAALLRLGFAHVVASDAHDTGRRAPGLSGVVAGVGGEAFRQLTCEGPAAAVEGRPIVPTRARSRTRFPWSGLRS